MTPNTNSHASTPAAVSAAHKQLTELIGRALLSVKNAHGADLWKLHSVLATEAHISRRAEPAGAVQLSFQGAAEGAVHLHIEQNGADHLFSPKPGEVEDQNAQNNWLDFVRSAEPALKQTLAADFGTPLLEDERPTATSSLILIGELQLRADGSSAAATVVVFIDPTMRASLEKLAGTAELDEKGLDHRRHDETQLHRVIDVPLAVTLRFGQRQMTLRELLALTTGSLVELDRQVEEPVDLMLGERVLARGEVVIVDGNYGLRITEIVEKQVARELTVAA